MRPDPRSATAPRQTPLGLQGERLLPRVGLRLQAASLLRPRPREAAQPPSSLLKPVMEVGFRGGARCIRCVPLVQPYGKSERGYWPNREYVDGGGVSTVRGKGIRPFLSPRPRLPWLAE